MTFVSDLEHKDTMSSGADVARDWHRKYLFVGRLVVVVVVVSARIFGSKNFRIFWFMKKIHNCMYEKMQTIFFICVSSFVSPCDL